MSDARVSGPMAATPRISPIEARSIAAGQIRIRPIEPDDDAAMAAIICAVMPEFGAGGCNTFYACDL